MTVVSPRRTGLTLPLTALGRWQRGPLLILAFEVIGAVRRGHFFGFSPKELILELAVLAAKFFDFRFQLLGAMNRASMLGLPIPGLLSQFGVLAAQIVDFVTQLVQLLTKLLHQLREISRRGLGGNRPWGSRGNLSDTLSSSGCPCLMP